MKCPSCLREIGHHALVKGPGGKLEPVVTRCPHSGEVVTLDPRGLGA